MARFDDDFLIEDEDFEPTEADFEDEVLAFENVDDEDTTEAWIDSWLEAAYEDRYLADLDY